MNILSISKKDNEAIVRLSSDELVRLGNIFYCVPDDKKDNTYYALYSEIMLARDLSQYGHIDGFCFERIAECRSKLVK